MEKKQSLDVAAGGPCSPPQGLACATAMRRHVHIGSRGAIDSSTTAAAAADDDRCRRSPPLQQLAAMGLEGVKTGAFFLRFFEMIFSIVVFSTIVDYDGSSRIKYTVRSRRALQQHGPVSSPSRRRELARAPRSLQCWRQSAHLLPPPVAPRADVCWYHRLRHRAVHDGPLRRRRARGGCRRRVAMHVAARRCAPPTRPALRCCAVRARQPLDRSATPTCLPQARGAVSFVLDLLWTILWLAAAGCVTSFLTDMPVETSKVRASTAFAWLSWFLWIGSTLISFQDWRGGVAGPPPAGAPTIPNSSVSMV